MKKKVKTKKPETTATALIHEINAKLNYLEDLINADLRMQGVKTRVSRIRITELRKGRK